MIEFMKELTPELDSDARMMTNHLMTGFTGYELPLGFFVDTDQGFVVGAAWASAYLLPSKRANTKLVVDPKYRGQGLGKKLFDCAMEWAKQHKDGYRETVVNPAIEKWFEAEGLVQTGTLGEAKLYRFPKEN